MRRQRGLRLPAQQAAAALSKQPPLASVVGAVGLARAYEHHLRDVEQRRHIVKLSLACVASSWLVAPDCL